MDKQFIHQYFEKATALVLAAAGVETVEKQALHLLAGEAERYAKALLPRLRKVHVAQNAQLLILRRLQRFSIAKDRRNPQVRYRYRRK